MDFLQAISNETVLVLGAGRSGLAATSLLLSHGARVLLCDDAPLAKLRHFALFKDREHPALKLQCGSTDYSLPPSCKALILSPGIALSHPLVVAALLQKIPVLNEIDLAFPLLGNAIVVGITGTNGKSTTTVMLETIIRKGGFKVWAGGNLGQPLCALFSEHPEADFDYVVLELSSYQLEALATLRLERAILLNITPDHLDRYGTIERYRAAKLRIAELVKKEGMLIINEDLRPLLATSAKVLSFKRDLCRNAFPNLVIRGMHNQENASAAAACAESLGISPKVIEAGLSSFKALPHRCELVALKDGIAFINDSKGTTVDAVKMALSMTEGPVQLLLGGLAKGEDFGALKPAHFPSIAAYHVFGDAKQKIVRELSSAKTHTYDTLDQAFKGALNIAQAGHTILLSPGCASFDQFTDFNARGEHFRHLVNSLRFTTCS